jgi:EAL domain-containing protein (putative c-di-GMP-specific phosphodiesterase class I)
VLMEGVVDEAEVQRVLTRLVEDLRRPFRVGDGQVGVSASVGVRLGDPRDLVESLVGDADVAMYVAKAQGKNQLVVFEKDMRMEALERIDLRSELHSAIENGDLVVHYQPVVELSTGQVSGFEALVRWEHPVRGTVPPDRFISIAEETGLVVPLGRWVLREACRQLAEWQAAGLVNDRLRMSVNLSAYELLTPGVTEDVLLVLRETGIRPEQLTLEVTETALMGEPERAGEVLSAFAELGVAVAIDDFGTGYSSFAYLQRFPVDVIKVDRSFVSRIAEGPEQAALAHAIVKLAQTLRIATVAEGVEELAQAEILRGWGCSHGQGWWWARAMPVDAGAAWLAERRQPDGRVLAIATPGAAPAGAAAR